EPPRRPGSGGSRHARRRTRFGGPAGRLAGRGLRPGDTGVALCANARPKAGERCRVRPWPAGLRRGAVGARGNAVRIVVAGAGAVGGLLGGWLALAGHRVTLVGRQAMVDRVHARGLQLQWPGRERTVTAGLTAVTDLNR